jgi:hypothetical protein
MAITVGLAYVENRRPREPLLQLASALPGDNNDAMKALQRGFALQCEQNPLEMEVLQQYGTVYRMRCTQEVFALAVMRSGSLR